ncbi:hypothetical protein AAFF_G00014430 [Aldrovandia affinis]|uniref:Uncharacterized protein n=1 Tax=Aldrovandia affinis TaxID=143900 RepID=A0AAD7R4T6_9TELE|nr:hypothetical protein AAFF_G00014430 [Aldrovandia affinis]
MAAQSLQQQKVSYAGPSSQQAGIKTQFFSTSVSATPKAAGPQQIQMQAQSQVQVIPAGPAQVLQQKLIQQQVVTAAAPADPDPAPSQPGPAPGHAHRRPGAAG